MIKLLIICILFQLISSFTIAQNLVQYVNPFIGTSNNGNTYPNAVAPQGMISVGVQNDDFFNKPSYYPISYTYGGSIFYGISHTNLSGVGCPDSGSLLLFPQSDSISLKCLNGGVPLSNEKASPGYYRSTINHNIQFQATVAIRSSIEEFTFSSDKNFLLINLGQNLSKVDGAAIRIISNQEIVGHQMEGRFCNRSPERTLYFVIRLSEPAKEIQIFDEMNLKPSAYKYFAGNKIGAAISLGNIKKIRIKVGISYVSEKNAIANLEQEIPHWDFQKASEEVSNHWEKLLSKIKVKGGSKNDKIKFYSALYHVLLHPNSINDVNGDYPLMGNQQGTGNVKKGHRYTVFSLWDTYRTVHPLLTLIYPELQEQMLQTMVDMYKESGQLPKWEVGAGESYTMVGDPAPIVIADSYLKGIKNFDVQSAYKAMLKQASQTGTNNHIRPGYNSLLKYGYIPNDDKGGDYVWGSVSTALEYYLADWCISQLAGKLGDKENEAVFIKRAMGYQNYYDPQYQLLRPKLANGNWVKDFDPLDDWRELGWKPSGGIGFVEGNAWQYTWFVPYDMKGLIQLMGGEKQFTQQLHTCFDKRYFVLSNEPDMAYPWLFNYVKGEEERTNETVKYCIDNYFGTGANGLPGNDDCGTLSAWLIFAMMGIYPDCPGNPNYQTALPVFDEIEIDLNQKYYPRSKLLIGKKESAILINGLKTGSLVTHQLLTE